MHTTVSRIRNTWQCSMEPSVTTFKIWQYMLIIYVDFVKKKNGAVLHRMQCIKVLLCMDLLVRYTVFHIMGWTALGCYCYLQQPLHSCFLHNDSFGQDRVRLSKCHLGPQWRRGLQFWIISWWARSGSAGVRGLQLHSVVVRQSCSKCSNCTRVEGREVEKKVKYYK